MPSDGRSQPAVQRPREAVTEIQVAKKAGEHPAICAHSPGRHATSKPRNAGSPSCLPSLIACSRRSSKIPGRPVLARPRPALGHLRSSDYYCTSSTGTRERFSAPFATLPRCARSRPVTARAPSTSTSGTVIARRCQQALERHANTHFALCRPTGPVELTQLCRRCSRPLIRINLVAWPRRQTDMDWHAVE